MCHTLLFTFLPLPKPNSIMSCCYSNMEWNISFIIQPMSIPNQIREIKDICCCSYTKDNHKRIYFLGMRYIVKFSSEASFGFKLTTLNSNKSGQG